MDEKNEIPSDQNDENKQNENLSDDNNEQVPDKPKNPEPPDEQSPPKENNWEDQKYSYIRKKSKSDEKTQVAVEPYDHTNLSNGFFSKFKIVDAVLKDRDSVFAAIRTGEGLGQFIVSMLIVVFFFGAVYGAITGMYANQNRIQILYSAIKLPLLLLLSVGICFPTFYIFNSMLGSQLSVQKTAPILLMISVMTSVIILGFAPIVWFFTVSLGGYKFLLGMHITFFAMATIIGGSYVNKALYHAECEDDENNNSGAMIKLWYGLYCFVMCQMFAYLGPFMTYGPFFTGDRIFFLELLGEVWKNAV